MIDRIGDAVERELGRLGPAAGVGKIAERWRDAVGDAIAQNAQPVRVNRDGTLVVHTSSSAWAFELTQLAPSIGERLDDLAPRGLKFIPGPLTGTTEPPPADAAPARVEPSPEDVAGAAGIAAPIEDEKLRKLVARAAAASLARARADRRF